MGRRGVRQAGHGRVLHSFIIMLHTTACDEKTKGKRNHNYPVFQFNPQITIVLVGTI